MALFDIFGDHLTRQTKKNVSRQPLTNIGKKPPYNIITLEYYINNNLRSHSTTVHSKFKFSR